MTLLEYVLTYVPTNFFRPPKLKIPVISVQSIGITKVSLHLQEVSSITVKSYAVQVAL